MIRATRSLAAALVLAATLAPSAAFAWPVGRMLHFHSKNANNDGRLAVHVYNGATVFYDIKIAGQTYTVLPHHSVLVTAPAGTQIFAATPGLQFHKGDLLATVSPATSNQTVVLR